MSPTPPASALDALPPGRRDVLLRLKADGPSRRADLAKALRVTSEAVRQTLAALVRSGWVRRCAVEPSRGKRASGRPAARFALTPAGEELFPRAYADLAASLVDVVANTLGAEALDRVLTAVTDARVAALEPLVRGKTLEERLDVARAVYREGDAHLVVRKDGPTWRIEERNCPFLAVAMRRPLLCSTTVATLSRLLGVRVVREERFQDGASRCVFRVDPARPRPANAPRFAPEPEAANADGA